MKIKKTYAWDQSWTTNEAFWVNLESKWYVEPLLLKVSMFKHDAHWKNVFYFIQKYYGI